MVSIITVNYNNTQVTIELLTSVARLERSDLEVIVVDNGSRENPVETFRALFPWAIFIRSEKNLGFAGGNNLGISRAKGEYFFFVNNDTEFKTDIIPGMISLLELNPHIGIVCPVIHYFDTPQQVQYAGYTHLNKITGRNRCITTNTNGENRLVITSYAHGAAMMIPRRVIDLVGPMPEAYFLYYEEFDWCEMIKRRGYSIAVDTRAIFYHKESRTVATISELKSYFMSRNRILFIRRNSATPEQLLFWLYFVLIATPKALVEFFLKKQWKNMQAHLAGIGWNLRHGIDEQILGYKFNYLK